MLAPDVFHALLDTCHSESCFIYTGVEIHYILHLQKPNRLLHAEVHEEPVCNAALA